MRGLAPHYRRVYLDVLLGVAALVLTGAGMLQSWGVAPPVLVVALAASLMGYWLAYLHAASAIAGRSSGSFLYTDV